MRVVEIKKTEAEIYDLAMACRSAALIRADKTLMHILREPWREKLREFLSRGKGSQSLDLGCGSGGWSRRLHTLGSQVVGIDISMGRIKVAIETTASEGIENVFFLVGDAENLPFRDDYFDTVLCASILHHLPNLSATMVEMKRVLKKGGSVVLSEPGLLNPFAFVRRKFFPSAIHTPDERPFVPSRLVKQVEYHFRNARCEHFYFLSCALPFLRCFIGYLPARMLMFLLYRLDRFLLSHFDMIRQFSWIIVMTADKP